MISVVPTMAEQGAKGSIAGMINSFWPKMACRTSAGMILRSAYCTLLLKEAFNPKAVWKLMGHAKELITMDVYADNKGIISDGGQKWRNI